MQNNGIDSKYETSKHLQYRKEIDKYDKNNNINSNPESLTSRVKNLWNKVYQKKMDKLIKEYEHSKYLIGDKYEVLKHISDDKKRIDDITDAFDYQMIK